MQKKSKRFPKHACQYCGTERKLVETIIDDEFCWNNNTHQYEPVRSLTFLNTPASNDVPNVKKSGRAYKSDWGVN